MSDATPPGGTPAPQTSPPAPSVVDALRAASDRVDAVRAASTPSDEAPAVTPDPAPVPAAAPAPAASPSDIAAELHDMLGEELRPWKIMLEQVKSPAPAPALSIPQAAYAWVKDTAHKLAGGLFMEQKADGQWYASLGRVSFWIVFLHLMYQWTHGAEPATNERELLYVLLGYAGVKIGMGSAKDIVGMIKGAGDAA